MGQFEDMALFVRIVDAGGISKAADQLNLAKSAVSKRLADLEKRLAMQLLNRTTRKSHLTEAGSRYYQRAKMILEEVDELNESTRGEQVRIDGTLKLAAPLSFGLLHLAPLIDEFTRAHPELDVQVDFSDRQVDLIQEGYELALRIGQLHDSSLQARRITPIKHLLCASAGYINEHGQPASPRELIHHQYLHYGMSNEAKLPLRDANGAWHNTDLIAHIAANNGDFLKAMVLKNRGITVLPTFLIYQELQRGEIVQVMPDFSAAPMQAYAVYPQNRFLSQRCRLFIDFIAERFGEEPYWDAID
jgi:DNA-binding transcriptional LysR family regulator